MGTTDTIIVETTNSIPLKIYKDECYDNPNKHTYSITGYVKRLHHIVGDFDSAYDFQEWVKENNPHSKKMEFDSESCQFWAYTTNKRDAISFIKHIDRTITKLNKGWKDIQKKYS